MALEHSMDQLIAPSSPFNTFLMSVECSRCRKCAVPLAGSQSTTHGRENA